MGRGGPKVLDISDGIPGAYAALLLHHAGATVARGERAAGIRCDGGGWRRASRTGTARSTATCARARPRCAWTTCRTTPAAPTCCSRRRTRKARSGSGPSPRVGPTSRSSRSPRSGSTGPLAHRPASDLTVQAESGALAIRGRPDEPPVQMGGRTVDWLAGAYAGVAGFVGWRAARAHGRGLFVDLALVRRGQPRRLQLHGPHARHRPRGRTANRWGRCEVGRSPSIEPTSDGWVGFNTNSPHHFEAFLRMLERPDLIETGEFTMAAMRERAERGVERGHPRLDPPAHHRRGHRTGGGRGRAGRAGQQRPHGARARPRGRPRRVGRLARRRLPHAVPTLAGRR